MSRPFVLLLACAVSAAVLIGACGFPDLTYGSSDEQEGGALDGADVEAGTMHDAEGGSALDGSAHEDAGEILIDGSSPDALIVQDAGTKVDGACGAADCDCDHDGFTNNAKPACSGTADCDDRDSRTHPNQGFLLAEGEFPQQGDWDCSGTVETLYKTAVTCSGLNLGLGCANIFGFEDIPACGKTGSFIRCERASLLSLSCTVGSRESRTQPCR